MPTSLLQKLLVLTLLAVAINLPTYASDHSDLTLNGIASYWILNNELYVGSLYLEQKQGTAEGIVNNTGRKRMEFRITTDKWRERNFSKTWSRAIYINNDDAVSKSLSTEIIAFSNILQGPLLYGDKVTIDYTPAKNTQVSINGTALYTTKNNEFFNALIQAWVGSRPPSTDFKKGILNVDPKNIDTQDLLSRYDYIRPDLENQRNNEIANWAKAQKKTNVSAKPRPIVKKPVNIPKPKVQAVPAAVKTQSKPVTTQAAAVTASPTITSPALPAAAMTNTGNEPTANAAKENTAEIIASPTITAGTPPNITSAAETPTTPMTPAADTEPVAPTAFEPTKKEEAAAIAPKLAIIEESTTTTTAATAAQSTVANSTETAVEQDIAPASSNTVSKEAPQEVVTNNTPTDVTNIAGTAEEQEAMADTLSSKTVEAAPSDNAFESILLELENKALAD